MPKRAGLRRVEMMKRKHATAVIPKRASSMMTLIHIKKEASASAFFYALANKARALIE